MKYLRPILILTSCPFMMSANADDINNPASFNTSTNKLSLPYIEIIANDHNHAQSFAEAELSLQGDHFVLDSANILTVTGTTVIGSDLNSTSNPLIQPTDDALSGGGRNQSLNFGDVIMGSAGNDTLIGGLGIDVIMGKQGDDVLIGGTEDFNPENRDRAFGGSGNDAFIWAPGDGSDYFNGGSGLDVVIFGKLDEIDGDGSKSTVETDQNFDGIFINHETSLPSVDVTNSPGFCNIFDSSNKDDTELAALDLDHLVQFVIRGIANSFESGEQSSDNGLRVTLHLKDVEYIVCTSRSGGEIEVFNIAVQPATVAHLHDLPQRFQDLIK